MSYNKTPDFVSWQEEPGFGLYLHIPFCKTRCQFCEYVTMAAPSEAKVDLYLDTLRNELDFYRERIDFSHKTLYGFDIGGGTPTLLSELQLERLLHPLLPFLNSLHKAADYEQSIETNPEIACYNPNLLKLLTDYGFSRISMGIQTENSTLLKNMNRGYQSNLKYDLAIENFRKVGFKKINLDIMYGLPNQTLQSWEETLRFIIGFQPDQISVYETRYKDSLLSNQSSCLDLDVLIRMYELSYALLTDAGYSALYGSSAFTKNPQDEGLSSYLRKRTTEFIPYLGLGIGSQSMTSKYLSYNYGKNKFSLSGYIDAVNAGRPLEFYYQLPQDELCAKYIAIAFYLGYIHYKNLEQRLGFDFLATYKDQIAFLTEHGLIGITDDKITLTREGYCVYHGIIALFHSNVVQEYISRL